MPKKREASTLIDPAAKKVRIGDSSIIDDENDKFPSGRSKRASTGNPQYSLTRKQGLTQKGVPDETPTARKRGRPPKTATETAVEPTPTSKKRGRPPKTAIEDEPEDLPAKSILKRGRGRPSKKGQPEQLKRGQQNKTASVAENTEANAKIGAKTPAKRGRKPKVIQAIIIPGATTDTREAVVPAKDADLKNAGATPLSDGEDKPNMTDTDATTSADEKYSKEILARIDEKTQYWLMKAEPDSRIEKGHDVKFSIDDLRDRQEPEPWDGKIPMFLTLSSMLTFPGVRNHAARNHMRAMRKGDLAFFYHSNTKEPGIAGVMRVVDEHAVDESAFDPKHPYYDPKSYRDKPTWECVGVEFVHKFEALVGLKALKKWGEAGGVLQNMQMLKQSRLSVSSVKPKEWRFILEQAGEDALLGIEKKDGYESDVDGEGGDISASDHAAGAVVKTSPHVPNDSGE